MIAFVLALATAAPTMAVPFVGCRQDGQQGPQPAPRPRPTPLVPATAAPRLAYYASDELGVLAPRGWNCLGLSGSNGGFLVVAPETLISNRLLLDWHQLHGSAIQLSLSIGGTSGRFEVARLIAQLFPSQAAFARRVAAEGIGDPLPAGPPPHDRLVRLGANEMRYVTPAGRDGLGTQSRLAPSGESIIGYARLSSGADMSAVKLDIRLPRAVAALAETIIAETRTHHW